jgi:hypothetical protein
MSFLVVQFEDESIDVVYSMWILESGKDGNKSCIAYPGRSERTAAFKKLQKPKKHWKRYNVDILHHSIGKFISQPFNFFLINAIILDTYERAAGITKEMSELENIEENEHAAKRRKIVKKNPYTLMEQEAADDYSNLIPKHFKDKEKDLSGENSSDSSDENDDLENNTNQSTEYFDSPFPNLENLQVIQKELKMRNIREQKTHGKCNPSTSGYRKKLSYQDKSQNITNNSNGPTENSYGLETNQAASGNLDNSKPPSNTQQTDLSNFPIVYELQCGQQSNSRLHDQIESQSSGVIANNKCNPSTSGNRSSLKTSVKQLSYQNNQQNKTRNINGPSRSSTGLETTRAANGNLDTTQQIDLSNIPIVYELDSSQFLNSNEFQSSSNHETVNFINTVSKVFIKS